jgi:hypothetical protein
MCTPRRRDVVFLQPPVSDHPPQRPGGNPSAREGKGSRMGIIGLLVALILVIILLRLIA